MRHDLLALTPDDLVLLANRGLVKRAQQELQAGELHVAMDEGGDGTVTARWSDDVTCVLPGDKPVSAGRCTCPATTICRHLLRSVLAYQQQAAPRDEAAPAPVEPWNPGAILDEELAQHLGRSALAWARQAFDAGQVVELVRSAKPSAYLHSLACSVRFLVPGDLRYTYCPCAEPAPCRHVPLAVLAFRLLGPEQASGIVETAPSAYATPLELLDEVESALRELVVSGIAGAPQAQIERLRRLETRLRAAGLIWPADAVADLVEQHAAYAAHDARFAPPQVAALVGELCARCDAIRANTGAVPQLFVRGAKSERETSMGTARLIGLGCGVRFQRGVELAAYLQDADSGALVVVRRDVADPQDPAVEPASFWQLAQAPVAKGASIGALGSGQVLIKGGRRLPNGSFVPGRAQLALNPQGYAWEALRAPVLAEDVTELAARIAAQPPAALRARRLTEGLYVCAVAEVEYATFDLAQQLVRAVIRDSAGAQALLVHPYTSRGQSGVEALLDALKNQAGNLRFVAGHVRLAPRGPVIAPTALVFQNGATRLGLLPWVAREQADQATATTPSNTHTPSNGDPLADYWTQIEVALGDLLVVGLGRADEGQRRRWRELARLGAALGWGQLLQSVERLVAALDEQASTARWDAAPTSEVVLTLACLALLAGDAIGAV